MSFADPTTVTVNSVAQSLARVGSNLGTRGSFSTSDKVYSFAVTQNQTTARFRREIRLTKKAIAADPISAVNKEVTASIIIAVDTPKWGFTDAEYKQMIDGLMAYFVTARQTQLLTGEL
jgi:hypothetical protein